MAERRMFTQKIVDSDAFLDMPLSAQCLYFHLNMRADDDGFVNNPKKIQRMLGATEDDLRLLMAKRFIIGFANGVIVIKHWRMHNLLRKDRYNPTQYQDEYKMLELKENGAYTEHDNQMATTWQPNGNQMAPQDSIGKLSIVEDSTNNTFTDGEQAYSFADEFEYVWNMYPRKQGKQNAFKAYEKARRAGTPQQEIIDGLNGYLNYIKIERVSPKYIAMGSTWFNQNRWKDDYTVHREPTTKDLADQFDYSDW